MDILTILNLGIILFFLSAIIYAIRIYHRTKMKSFLMFIVGEAAFCVGILSLVNVGFELQNNLEVFNDLEYLKQLLQKNFNGWLILSSLFLLIFGGLLISMGFTFLVTAESGIWKEIRKRASCWKLLLGSPPVIEREQFPPSIKKQHGLIAGILYLLLGHLTIIWDPFNLYKDPELPRVFAILIVSLAFFIPGFFMIIFSLIYLKK